MLAREVAAAAARSLAAESPERRPEELVVVVDLARMGDVAESVSGLVAELSSDPVVGASALEAVRTWVVRWGPGGEMSDVAALGAALSEALAAGPARSAAEGLARAARMVVPIREGPGVRWAEERGVAGIGIFLPAPLAEPWSEYVVEAPFARETGWAGLLEAVRAAAVEGVAAPDAQGE